MSLCVTCSAVCDGVERVMAAPCGHIFHAKCVLKLIDEDKTCPECGENICLKNCTELYFNVTSSETSLRIEVENLKALLQERGSEIQDVTTKNEKLNEIIAVHNTNIDELREENTKLETDWNKSMSNLRELKRAIEEVIQLRQTILEMKRNKNLGMADVKIVLKTPVKQIQKPKPNQTFTMRPVKPKCERKKRKMM